MSTMTVAGYERSIRDQIAILIEALPEGSRSRVLTEVCGRFGMMPLPLMPEPAPAAPTGTRCRNCRKEIVEDSDGGEPYWTHTSGFVCCYASTAPEVATP